MAKKTAATPKANAPAPKQVKLHEAPTSTQSKLFSGINALLKEHGVSGKVSMLQLDPAAAKAIPAAVAVGCPPGQVRKTVCFRREDGTIVCEEKCVPL